MRFKKQSVVLSIIILLGLHAPTQFNQADADDEMVDGQEVERHPAALNIVFGLDPGEGRYDGVVGQPDDTWNLLDVGQTSIDGLRSHTGAVTPVELKVSENDGEWGIPDQHGIFHAYIYHNSQSVDLQATVSGLSRGFYRIYVYAHGDAPNQNAEIVLQVGDDEYEGKTTLNDGSFDYRSPIFTEGVQYVSFDFAVDEEDTVIVTSKRDGSGYSMFNAIQIVRIMR